MTKKNAMKAALYIQGLYLQEICSSYCKKEPVSSILTSRQVSRDGEKAKVWDYMTDSLHLVGHFFCNFPKLFLSMQLCSKLCLCLAM